MPQIAIGAALAGIGSGAAAGIASGSFALSVIGPAALKGALIAGVTGLATLLLNRRRAPEAAGTASHMSADNGAVVAAVYRLGRVKADGLRVWEHVDGDWLHRVYALSEGECDGIEALWVQGDRIPLARKADPDGDILTPADDAPGRYKGYVEVREYFRADGTQGARIRELAGTVSELAWGTAHKGTGISYALVSLRQNDWGGQDLTRRLWSGIPTPLFEFRGLKLRYPTDSAGTLSTAAWTANAAVVRAWWLMERRGVAPQEIDHTYLAASRALADQTLSVAGSTATAKRYEVNGSIAASADGSRMEDELDLAMDGRVVEWDGQFLIRAGGERSSRTTIDTDDVVGEPTLGIIGSWGDRVNAVTVELPASRRHDFERYALTVEDTSAQARDGSRLPASPIRPAFISDPIVARNVAVNLLRDARAQRTLQLKLKPRNDFSAVTLTPLDQVTVDMPELGLDESKWEIERSKVEADWSVRLFLREWVSGRYADVVRLDPIVPRVVRLAVPAPTPTGVTVRAAQVVAQDGGVSWVVTVSWDATAYLTRVTLAGGGRTYTVGPTRDGIATFRVYDEGTYSVTVVHSSSFTAPSPPTTVTGIFVGRPPPKPRLRRVESAGRFVHVALQPEARRDIAGAILRANFNAGQNASAPARITTETEWAAARELDIVSLVPSVAGTAPLYLNAYLIGTGFYALAIKTIGRAGQLSPLLDLGRHQFVVPGAGEVVMDEGVGIGEWGGRQRLFVGGVELARNANTDLYSEADYRRAEKWPATKTQCAVWDAGALTFLLPSPTPGDGPNYRDAVTRAQWDDGSAGGGWPFGPLASDTCHYEGTVIDMEARGQVEVRCEFTLRMPDVGTGGSVTLTARGRATATSAWANLPLPAVLIAGTSNEYSGTVTLPDARYVRVRATFSGGASYIALDEMEVRARALTG